MRGDPPNLPRDGVFDVTSLWLRHREGFRVYTPDGVLLGYVEEIWSGREPLVPETLTVRASGRSARLRHVATSTVAEIRPHEERVTLERAPAGTGLLEDLRGRLDVGDRAKGDPATTRRPGL
jgi:hypothetical protein